MPRQKGREKVTFAIPSYMLELVDLQAERMGLDRYDVLRTVISHGLAAISVDRVVIANAEAFTGQLLALTSDESKGRDTLTFMMPTTLLEQADRLAEDLSRDRYDVLRASIGQGWQVMQVQDELSANPQAYLLELQALQAGEPGAMRGLQEKLMDAVFERVSIQLRERKKVVS